jgi:uncharacterized protein with PIN domain
MDDIHAKRLTLAARLHVRLGRCPACRAKLENAVLEDLVESWEYHYPKYIARTLGDRNAPRTHNTEFPKCTYCPRCRTWYAGRWSYREGSA